VPFSVVERIWVEAKIYLFRSRFLCSIAVILTLTAMTYLLNPGCRLFDVESHDAGRYVCTVTNDVGSTRDTGELTVTGNCSLTVYFQFNSVQFKLSNTYT